jgi:hypothetical protein
MERGRDAWSVLRGLKVATVGPDAHQLDIDRVGSAPEDHYASLQVLSKSYEFYKYYTHLKPDRVSIYNDMDEMMQYVLASSAMDAYVEDALQEDPTTEKSIWPDSPSARVKAELQRLFEVLEIEDNAYGKIYSLGQYGDGFDLLLYNRERGLFDAAPMEVRVCHRHETAHRVLEGFTIGEVHEAPTKGAPKFKPWDLVHSKIKGRRPQDPYGSPFFIQTRLIYKVLKLMEEQMLLYRMNMHPDRLIFKIFTGNASPDQRMRILRQWKKNLERTVALNNVTGQYQAQYAPWQIDQNIYWPTGVGDDSSGVEKFPGSANVGEVFDVHYMRDLFFASVRVPKGYMGFEDSQGYRYGDTLSQQSIKFARGVKRLRKHYLQGLARKCRIHLALRGIDSRLPQNSFTLHMTPVSYLEEQQRAEMFAQRLDAVRSMIEIGEIMSAKMSINLEIWAKYVLHQYAGLDEPLIARLMTPQAQGGADMTFTPSGGSLTFEHLSQKERSELHKRITGDEQLRETLGKILPVEDLKSGGAYKLPSWDDVDLEQFAESYNAGEVTESNEDLRVRAMQTSHEKEGQLEAERQERLREDLKRLAKAAIESVKAKGLV